MIAVRSTLHVTPKGLYSERLPDVDVVTYVVDLRAQADAFMPASNNNVNSHYIL